VAFYISIDNKKKCYHNDNYRSTGHLPLNVYVSEEFLPRWDGWLYGETHAHSLYTSDQVEFGMPLEPAASMAKALGLNFFCVTDHSYDLDDYTNDYLKNDPDLKKWKSFHSETKRLNNQFEKSGANFAIIPGEEVSVGNYKGQNVHFLIYNNQEYIPGSGDSGEKWFRTRPDLTIDEMLKKKEKNAVAIAAHPGDDPPFLQKILIRRGKWWYQDVTNDEIRGLQILNGEINNFFRYGYKLWIKLLLEGKKIFITAGNDAHGNFNRFRQIGFPFFTMREMDEQIFGKAKTLIKVDRKITTNAVLESIKYGKSLITTGPIAKLLIKNETGEIAEFGETIHGKKFQIFVEAKSTKEIGKIKKIVLYCGNISEKKGT